MSISNNYTSLTRSSNGMQGLVSGLETDELIKALLGIAQSRIDKQDNKIKIYEYQQEAYRDVISEIDSFSNKYLSYTSSTSIISNSFYDQMTVSSSSDKFNVTAGSGAIDADMQMKIDKLATTTTMQGGTIESVSNIEGSINLDKLAESTIDKAAFTVTDASGNTDTVELSETEIESILNGDPISKGNMNFKVKDGKLEIEMDEGYSAVVNGSDDGSTSVGLAKLGLSAGTKTASYETTNSDDETVVVNGLTGKIDSDAEPFIEVNLDGVVKKISLSEIDDSDPSKVFDNLKEELKSLFGDGNIIVDGDADNFTISTKEGRQITFGGSEELLGGLGLKTGDSNSIAAGAAAGDIFESAFENASTETIDGEEVKYLDMTINGEEIRIYEDDSITSLVSKVNNSDAGVTMKFDSFTNTFSIESNESGAGRDMSFGATAEDDLLLKSILGVPADNTSSLNEVIEATKDPSYVPNTDEGVYFGYTAGQNAEFTLNGVKTERSTNEFTINGLTFELTDVHEEGDAADKITSSRDIDGIMEGITAFIDDYNTLIESLNGTIDEKYDKEYPPLTDEQKEEMTDQEITNWEAKAKEGILENDDIISDFLSEMRSTMYAPTGSDGTALWQIGIEASSDYFENGKLYIDETKLREVLTTDPDVVKNLFAGPDGLASKVSDVVKDYAGTSSASPGKLVEKAGVKGTATESNNTLYNYMQECMAKMEKYQINYDLQSARLWDSFTRMEVVLSNLSSQSAYLSQNAM